MWRSPTMQSILKTVEMDEETETKKINYKLVIFACRQCGRRFRNDRGNINHSRFCSPTPVDDEVCRPLAAVNKVDYNLNGADKAISEQQFFWGNTPGNQTIASSKSVMRKLCSGVKMLCYLKYQVTITLKKFLG